MFYSCGDKGVVELLQRGQISMGHCIYRSCPPCVRPARVVFPDSRDHMYRTVFNVWADCVTKPTGMVERKGGERDTRKDSQTAR